MGVYALSHSEENTKPSWTYQIKSAIVIWFGFIKHRMLSAKTVVLVSLFGNPVMTQHGGRVLIIDLQTTGRIVLNNKVYHYWHINVLAFEMPVYPVVLYRMPKNYGIVVVCQQTVINEPATGLS